MTQKGKTQLNGSSDLLAQAIRQVFEETMSVHEASMEPKFREINEKLDTVNSDLSEIKFRQGQHQKALDGLKNKPPQKRTGRRA